MGRDRARILRRVRIPGSDRVLREQKGGKGHAEETATKYCVRAENTALGTRVSGAAGFRMSRSARRLYANSTQIPSRRYLYRSHTSEPAVAGCRCCCCCCCCCTGLLRAARRAFERPQSPVSLISTHEETTIYPRLHSFRAHVVYTHRPWVHQGPTKTGDSVVPLPVQPVSQRKPPGCTN